MKTKFILLSAILIIKIQSVHSQSWNLNGNGGTNTTNNFIGTTDNKALKIKTNNNVRMYISANGKIGIGTSSPAARFHIKGAATGTQLIVDAGTSQSNTEPLIRLRNAAGLDLLNIHSDDTSNIFIGVHAGRMNVASSGGRYNTFIGSRAGESNVDGYWNTAVGHNALSVNSTGAFNTACGSSALNYNTYGEFNTAMGYGALRMNIYGSNNTAIGEAALYFNTTGYYNTALGCASLVQNTTGERNSAFGYQSMEDNEDGVYNTAGGYQCLKNNESGSINTAYGHLAMYTNTTGNWNTANGHQALYFNNGTANSAFGLNGLYNTTSGGYNTACGYQALFLNTTGFYNVAVGGNTNYYNTSASLNTAVGFDAGCNNGTFPTNFSAFGYNAGHIGSNSNTIELGNTSVTWIGGQVGWWTSSDRRIKDNVQSNVPGLSFITKLNPVTYNLNIHKQNELCGINDTIEWEGKYDIEKIIQTGFIAQEVEQAAKECDYNFNGVSAPTENRKLYTVSYSAFVMPLVKAVQEQQQIIEKQQQEINELRSLITPVGKNQASAIAQPALLEQNIPNPFNTSTEIKFRTPSGFRHAQLMIYSSQGSLVKSYDIGQKNTGNITIAANTLSPGIYSYTLIVDQTAADVKQMIVTK